MNEVDDYCFRGKKSPKFLHSAVVMEVMPHAEDIHKNYLQKQFCSVKKT